jgi:thiamine pyrophosphokinase
VKAVVVAGGEADPRDAAQLADADLVVAADGGAHWLDAIGRRPDLVVGDLDSIEAPLLARLEAAGVPVERHPADKDVSDAELAVASALASGADEVVVVGGIGGERLDHELANLLLLANPRWEGRDLRLVRGGTTARVVRGGAGAVLRGAPGDLVTLLPLGGEASGVRTDRLSYPLDGETLAAGRTRGLSNVVAGTGASVRLERGILLVIEIEKEDA